MTKKKLEAVNGLFHSVVTVRDGSNIESYSILTIEIKDGAVVAVTSTQPDSPALTYNKADSILRSQTKPMHEVVVNAKA